jgi:type VI secretion system protein ImpK
MTRPLESNVLPVALRDTALLVTGLSLEARPDSSGTFREKCERCVTQLREQMSSAGHPADVIEDAAYAQCALLDEVALRHLKDNDRNEWERNPLQVEQFQSHDAGEELPRRIECRLLEKQPSLMLLAIFNAVLNLGFEGRFSRGGREARHALMHAIDGRLEQGGWRQADPADTTVIVGAPYVRPWHQRMNPLAWVVAACVVSGVVYLVLDRWLTASIDDLAR